jgi:hypothetical protein
LVLPGWRTRDEVLRVLLALSILSTVLAVSTGLLLAYEQDFQGRGLVIINRHRNLTLIAGGLCTTGALMWLIKRAIRWVRTTGTTLVVVGTIVLCIGIHFGGTSVHGEDFFDIGLLLEDNEEEPDEATPVTQGIDFDTQVRPILRKSCLRCHGKKKQKGELRLDTEDYAMEGGETGAVIEPGDSSDSELYRRVSLPTDDEDYMPSKGTPLTPRQVEVLKRWIDEGAKWPAAPTPTPSNPG